MSARRATGASPSRATRRGAAALPPLRFRGPIAALSADDRRALLERSTSADAAVRSRVAAILERVRRDGDQALLELARELDGVALAALEVPAERRRAALAGLDPALRAALERSARNLEAAHRALLPRESIVETEPGVRVGRRPEPLARVGVYAPGGRASYPSSVLMGAIPARVAGVGEVVLCSPPGADGMPAPAVLAAAELAGVARVFALGGAGAIGAMAFGTASVPRVDRIVGPGNAWVAEAKLQVAGFVAIDSPAGPSELLVIADRSADPALVAREMVAQAEHDPEACAVAVALDGTATAIEAALLAAAAAAGRAGIVARSLAAHGGVLAAGSLEEALAFANRYAAEHVLLALAAPRAALEALRGAGTVFVGSASSVAFGDYMTGANHVLPTGGLARSYSGLSTLDFVRWTTWQEVTPAAAAALAADVAGLAEAERLPGHAAAARAWGSGTSPRSAGDRAAAPAGGNAAARPQAAAPRRRAGYGEISLYAPGPASVAIDLSDNTNLFGVAPAALAVLREAAGAMVSRYPEPWSEALRQALAGYAGVRPEEVVVGCGSDDLLDAAFRALAEPGERVAHADPTFSMVPVFARANGLEPVPVPLASNLDIDADALLATAAPLLYLASPNNPTGTAAAAVAVERLLDRARGVVVLDEAYAEFSGTSRAREAPARGNLLVVRTLSKAFGLAGLRIGWAVGAAGLVAEVAKARGPYKVSAPAERAARAALEHDLAWVREAAAAAIASRERLAASLRERGFAPLPSAANFVLVPVADAAAAAAALERRGVAVRAFRGLTGIGDALRITAGPWPAMARLLEALDGVAPAREARP